MSSNNVTGDSIATKFGSKEAQENFENNWERIFGKKKKYSEDWQSVDRDKAIAQNGNVGYTDEEVNGKD